MKQRSGSRTQLLRRLVQLGFAAFILIAAVRHNTVGDAAGASSIDALCPFGGLETLWSQLATGRLIPKTHPSNLVIGAGLLVATLLAGGAFCGWICPLGSLQDLLTGIRRRLHLPEIKVPQKLDRVLIWGRYVVLAGILYATISTATMWFADYDPYRTLFSLSWLYELNLAAAWPAYAIALGVLVGAFFVPRLWCRYLCPLGGAISLVSRLSFLRIRRDASTCIKCNKCDRVCPVKVPVSTSSSITHECISCLQCVEACPVKDTLYVGTALGPAPAGKPQEAAQ